MTKNFKRLILLLLITIFTITSTANCFGKFALTRKAYAFNETLGGEGFFGKTLRTVVAYVYFLFPVYVVLFSDALVFNLIEYWTDNNLIGLNEFDKDGIYVKNFQKDRDSLTLTYLNFGKRLNIELVNKEHTEKFVVLRSEPGKIFKDNKGKLEEVSVVSKEVGSKMIFQILTYGKLESSKVVEAEDFKTLEKKYLGEFY
jgi:hypothetical protein